MGFGVLEGTTVRLFVLPNTLWLQQTMGYGSVPLTMMKLPTTPPSKRHRKWRCKAWRGIV